MAKSSRENRQENAMLDAIESNRVSRNSNFRDEKAPIVVSLKDTKKSIKSILHKMR